MDKQTEKLCNEAIVAALAGHPNRGHTINIELIMERMPRFSGERMERAQRTIANLAAQINGDVRN